MNKNILFLLAFGLLLLNADSILASQTGERGLIKRGFGDVDPDSQNGESDIEQRQKRIRLAYAACLATKCYPTCTCPSMHISSLGDWVHCNDLPKIRKLIKAGVCPDSLSSLNNTAFHYLQNPQAVTILCLDNPNRMKNPNIDTLNEVALTPLARLAIERRELADWGYPDTTNGKLLAMKKLVEYGADYSLGLGMPLASNIQKIIDAAPDTRFALPADIEYPLTDEEDEESVQVLTISGLTKDFIREAQKEAGEYINKDLIPLIKVQQMGVKGMKNLINKPLDHNKPFNAIKARQYFGTRPKQPRIHS